MTNIAIQGNAVAAHMRQVELRYAELDGERGERLQKRVNQVSESLNCKQRSALLQQAITSPTAAKKIHWLRRESDVVLALTANQVACQSNCSHCCHIGTMLAEGEARFISKAINKPLKEPEAENIIIFDSTVHNQSDLESAMRRGTAIAKMRFGQPCPFLIESNCSIYEHRPIACRHLLNADEDNLLCQLVQDQDVRVPYINMQQSQIAYVLAWGDKARMADIRDWF